MADEPSAPEIILTFHLGGRAKKRNFSDQQAIDTVVDPKLILKTPPRKGDNGGWIRRYQQEFDRRTLEVVAEEKSGKFWIITAYWLKA